jgi:hypothetical protein
MCRTIQVADDVRGVLEITQEKPMMDVHKKFYANKYEKQNGC